MTQQSAKQAGQKTQPTLQTCSVDGCDAKANRIASGLCEKHYTRLRRTGTTEKRRRPEKTKHSSGFARDDHPLAKGKPSGSRIYEHRMIFFDAFGGGDHNCHWCGEKVSFEDMHVDHVNAVKDDNRIENLVASCPPCNKQRGLQKMIGTMRSRGMMITWRGETKHVSEWAERLGISTVSLKSRIKSGWTLDDALTKPRGKCGPKGAAHPGVG